MRIDPTGRIWNPFNWFNDHIVKPLVNTTFDMAVGMAFTVNNNFNVISGFVSDGVNWLLTDPLGQFVLGALIIVGLGVLTVLTAGAATPVLGFIIAGAFKGALIGAALGAVVGYATGGMEGAASGFLFGAIGGGITGGIGNAARVGLAARSWTATTRNGVHLSPRQNMVQHFKDHGADFKNVFKSPVQFAKAARQAVEKGAYTGPAKNAYISFNRFSQKGVELYNYVGLNRLNNKITTFHVRNLGRIFTWIK
jgi:hypothetical protein